MPCDFASVVSRGVVLFETGFVFFVDDNHAQVGRRCEDGASGADNYLDVTTGDLLPIGVAFGVGQVAVQNGNRIKPTTKSTNRLRSQADFRDKHDRLTAIADDFLNRFDIHFGFTATGYSVE